MDHLPWLLANLAVPYFAPIIFLKTTRLLLSEEQHHSLRKRLRLTYLFKDGQYALTSLAISTAAFYELMSIDRATASAKVWLAVIGLFAIFSTILIVVGLINETEDPETAIPSGSGVFKWTTIQKWVKTYRVGFATVVMIIPVSIAAYNVHCVVLEQHDQLKNQTTTVTKKPIDSG